MEPVATRRRTQPPPPHVVFNDLTNPGRPTRRPWLHLLADEVAPRVLVSEHASVVVWSSIWLARPDAKVRFELASAESGTDLRFTLLPDPPIPDDDEIRTMRKRLGWLINGQLRYTYGQ
ncbi:hypothetical protein [Rhodococcoides corynebacterioides]|uniref:Uncharacterized protein n=1 Tax=Rhodococcoides corynebacterioides TaxID=53972 RepID=A0ABS7P7Y9_9NOCA|nr:hypothetical protein [Rhodococcus corynebacterioides]MBY6368435.1 hypothetical protein [Rhodococcus corynebacterioides]MBY6409781.1 hypothetical protein [Rhodococcus corynebacterioides]